MIAERLDGTRIAVTGSTGFLGTALVERLLRQVPGCELVLLVRPGKRSTPEQRARREIFRNDAFDRLVSALGRDAYWAEVERRVTVIAGDVGTDGLGLDDEGRRILARCDVVVHSAATVSFDAPLDTAVEVNLVGPTRIAAVLRELGSTAHLVAVSTCYVAGGRRGPAPEILLTDSPFHIDVDWRAEVDAARRARGDIDAESRTVARLAEFRARARHELGAAGTPLLAAKTEQLRQRWVTDQLAEAGRARAASLGWPDAYAYTKSLGERALTETRGPVPVSIVRPSIIESAWSEPRPGWIRGFRMAEPIIISYARGLLEEFPGVPEGVVDVIPVDLVVAAIIGVAARGPQPDVEVVQVASGTRNPLHYRTIVELVRDWFSENPVYDDKGQPIAVPEWSFPRPGAVQRQLRKVKRNLQAADKVLKALPLRGDQAQWNATVEDRLDQVQRAIGYVELYGAYAQSEALFGVERLLALLDELPADDRRAFDADPAVVDWPTYIQAVHLPSVVRHARVKTTPERSDPDARQNRLRGRVLAPERQLAAFDLENTIIASNVVASYSFLATRRMGPAERVRFVLRTIAEGPGLLALDKRDRTDFLRHFYRRYEGAPVDLLEGDAQALLSEHILTKAFPAAVRRVRQHRALGHRTVLITGALDFVVRPLAPLFDDIVAAEMTVRHGAYTGELAMVPPTGEIRAQALRDYAAAHDLDLAESVAYADSSSDLPFLEAVGFPVAVNPETRLASIAAKRGWLVEQWTKSPGGSDPALPLAPLPTRRRSRR
jgi:HAD superfamily hydrolase (TIGR01490 family)